MASGQIIPPPGDGAIEELWTPSEVPTPVSKASRQGWKNDPIKRKAVEDYAQERLTAYYEADGWTVTDTRVGNPYDALATKDDEMLYLEAKGTETVGQAVLVTPNEVSWARTNIGQCRLGIVSGVRFKSDGSLDRKSGELRVFEWDPNGGTLLPSGYTWSPPSG